MPDGQQGIHRVKKPGAPEDYVLVRDNGPGIDEGGSGTDPAMEFSMPESMYRFKRIEPPLDSLPWEG